MAQKWRLCLLCIPVVLLAAAEQSWQQKQTSEWNKDDVQQILTDSPWAKPVKPKITNFVEKRSGRRGPMFDAGGFGMGLPETGGMGRHRGTAQPTDTGASLSSPPTLTVRWESALPEQLAELKARNTSAPAVDENHYVIAVYGIPNGTINTNYSGLENELKGQVAIKKKDKKEIKSSGVEIIPRDDSTVVVYSFSRSNEITPQDKEVEFDAQIGRLQVSQSFTLDDMVYQGKLSL